MAGTARPSHPYYPQGLQLSHYAENEWEVPRLIATFAAGCATLLGITLWTVKKCSPHLKIADQALVLWFVLSKFPLSRFLLSSNLRHSWGDPLLL